MHGRANIMKKAGQRQFCGSGSAPNRVARFQDTDGMTRAGNFDGRRKAVRARADNDRIKFHGIILYR